MFMKFLLLFLLCVSFSECHSKEYLVINVLNDPDKTKEVKDYMEKGYKLGGFSCNSNHYSRGCFQVVYKDD